MNKVMNLLARFMSLLLAFTMLATSSSNIVMAAPEIYWSDILDVVANRAHYRPGEDECTTSSTDQQNTAQGGMGDGNIYVLGDSISYGLKLDKLDEQLKTKFNREVKINYDGGRSITTPGTQSGVSPHVSALTAADNDKDFIKASGTIIIVLGTNQQDDPFLENLTKLVQKLKAPDFAPNAKFYWVDIGATGSKQVTGWNARNKIIYDNAGALGYAVISRYKAIFGAQANPLDITPGQLFPGVTSSESVSDYGEGSVHGGNSALSGAIISMLGSNSGAASTAAPTTAANNIDVTYTDGSRSGRAVGVTFWLPTKTKAPLVLFAPGRFQNSKTDGFYKRYLRAIADQGFVVAGINPPDNTTMQSALEGGVDIKFVIDSALADSGIKDKIDSGAGIGLVGHSDGGFVSLMGGYDSSKQDKRIKAVVSADGAIYAGTNNVAGPPLLLIHGDADIIQNISSSSGAFGSLNTPYSAFATIKGADHDKYITKDDSTYKSVVDSLTGAFLKRMLYKEATDATDLKKISDQNTDKVSLQEKGNNSPNGSGGNSESESTDPACTCSIAGGSSTVASTLPAAVPEPHRSLFTEAAAKFNVNPAYLTALFLSEQGNVWKPFDSPWASSPAGASGPFQFIPTTWSGHATDGDNDGKADIMNIRDAAYSAAHLIAAGTTVDTPLGDLQKPFKDPNTILYNAAAYNWGGGNIQTHTNPDSPLSDAPTETENYLINVSSLILSGFTKSDYATYGNPRMPGAPATGTSGSGGGSSGSATSETKSPCPTQSGGGTYTPITADHAELVKRILENGNIKWGNAPSISSAAEQKLDIQDCLTDKALLGLLAMAEQSGVTVPINTMARGHGGCSGGRSDHNNGGAIDIGYWGNGNANHVDDGDKLFKFIYDNREALPVGQLIWKMPPDGYQCLNAGKPVDCYGFYGADTMNVHHHHIHVSFTK